MTTNNLPAQLGPSAVPLTAPPRPASDLGPAEYGGGLDWPRILNALRRFKWLILAVTVLGTAAGAGMTRLLKPMYEAQATVWIDEGGRRTPERGPIGAGQLLESDAWVDLLKSYSVLDEVVRDQRLFFATKKPDDASLFATFQLAEQYRPDVYRLAVDESGKSYTLSTVAGIDIERGAVGDSVGRRLGFRWAPSALPAGRSIQFQVTTARDAAKRLADSLGVQIDPGGSFLRIELRGHDPVRVAAIVNAVVDRYVQVAADLKRRKLSELAKILEEQTRSAQQNLRDAERAVQTFRAQTITLPSDQPSAAGVAAGRDPVFTTFFNTQLEREQARRDREALEGLLAQAGDSGLSPDALGVIGSVQRSSELTQALKELTGKQADLRALRYRYSDDYPPVQRLAGEIKTLQRQTIPTLLRGLVSELAAREGELGRTIDGDSRNLRQIPQRTIEDARLRRDLTMAENLYTTLQQRYDEARLADASTVPDIRVLDSAVVPQRPVKNRAPAVVLLSVLASLGVALVGAVLLDRVDQRFRYPDQVSREMGLTILGAVPHLRSGTGAGGNGVGSKGGGGAGKARGRPAEDITQVIEALRGVCLNVIYTHGSGGPLTLTITSPGAGDGKSFISANLAHTFAEGGHRVLLIDGDIRRGVLHRRLNTRRQPGLSDYLRGEVPLQAILQVTPHRGLTVVGCGTRASNAPELLGSQTMADLINRLRSSYDVLLIDSPPLGAGVDPLVLGTLSANLLLVLRTGYSHRDVTAAKLEVLQRLPVKVLGAVMNDVPPGAGYYRYYYSYYMPGYEAVDEESGRKEGQPQGV